MLSLMRTLKRFTESWRQTPADSPPAPATPVSEPGASWGGLEIRELISSGAFGTVYKAYDPALDREVALKLYATETSGGFESKAVEEGRLLARLRHENIAAVYGAGVYQGRVGLWMELVRGQSLDEAIAARGAMSAREVALVGSDICHALAMVHAAGLLHRDVKPQNVMRETGGRIVLIDFGLGEERRPGAASPRELAGTPLYMAPELLDGGRATIQSEVYALGVLLFYLATGRHPVEASSLDDLRQAHRRPRLQLRELRPELPAAFIELVERATAADPGDRYRSVVEMQPHLQTVIGPHARPVFPAVPRRWILRGAVLAGSLAAGSGVWWWITRAPTAARPMIWITETLAPPGQPDYVGLTVALREQIAQSDILRVFDNAQVPVLLDRMTLPRESRVTGRLRRELAQRGGVSYIVDSTVLQMGGELRLKVAVESVGPLAMIAAGKAEREFSFEDPSRVSAALQKASEWVRQTAREPVAEIAVANNSPAEITTNSLSALAHFARGERLAVAGDTLQALSEWKAAVADDADFLQAHMRLGDVLRANNRQLESLQQYAAAYRLLNKRKLGLRESFRIQSAFLYDTGDMMGADAIHAEWAARYPEDAEPLIKRGRPLLYSGRPREAIEALRRAEQLDPRSPSAPWLLAVCDIAIGDWDMASQDAKRLRSLAWTDQADLLDADVQFLQGHARQALRGMLTVRDRNRSDAGRSELRINAVLQAAALWSDLSRPEEAVRLLEDDLSPGHSMGAPADLAREEVALSRVRLEEGDLAGAQAAALAALDLEAGPQVLRTAGSLLVIAGGQDQALARVQAFESGIQVEEARRWRVTRIPRLLVEGQILLRAGRARAAIPKLQEAAGLDTPESPHDVLAQALESAGDRQLALEEWLRIADNYDLLCSLSQYFPPGVGRPALEHAVRLCDQAGNSAGTEARCTQARQRLGLLRNIVVPN